MARAKALGQDGELQVAHAARSECAGGRVRGDGVREHVQIAVDGMSVPPPRQ